MIELNDPLGITKTDFAKTILRAIHRGTPDLRDEELGNVLDRTPMLTGALKRDETGEYNLSDIEDPELIHLYTATENQMQAWNRIYAQYVEGPPLGISTWTNPPRQMFNKATTMDIPDIEAWCLKALNKGISDIVSGSGVKI